ncbi:MAG: LysM peptidoglycan-binding domain-containing protein, partial [Candidatus Acidiferrales bacterium]
VQARSETTRPVAKKPEMQIPPETTSVEDSEDSPREIRPSEMAIVEADSRSEGEKGSTSAEVSAPMTAAVSGEKESSTQSHLQLSIQPESQKNEIGVVREVITAEPAGPIPSLQLGQRGNSKESGKLSATHKARLTNVVSGKENSISSLPDGLGLAGKAQPVAPNPSVSIFQKSGQVWRRIFRKGAFSYGLVLLLGLAFLWPSRHLTPVDATPATDAAKPQQARNVALAETRETTNPRATDQAPETIVVKPAETLSGLMKNHIGTYDDKTLEKVQSLNPEIKDPNLIIVGQKIQLPRAAPESSDGNSRASDPSVSR